MGKFSEDNRVQYYFSNTHPTHNTERGAVLHIIRRSLKETEEETTVFSVNK